MKAIFSIQSAEGLPEEELQLAIEWSPAQISFLIFAKQVSTVYALWVYQNEAGADTEKTAAHIKDFLESDTLLNKRFQAVDIYYDIAESVLVPAKYYNVETRGDMLDLQYGEAAAVIAFSDFIPSSEMVNIFRVPANIHNSLMQFFPMARISHSGSQILGMTAETGTVLKLVLGQERVTMFFYSNNNLLLHQYFDYTGPEDVAYHCLNICARFDIPPDDCQLVLSGYIEADSNLYKSLYKYFLQTSFIVPNETLQVGEAFAQFPAHMFYPITRKALCE